MEATKAKIREFLSKHFRNYNLQEEEDIFGAGFVTSLFAMELVMFVESEFQIRIENEDLDLDNFRSIKALAGLIERKTAHAS